MRVLFYTVELKILYFIILFTFYSRNFSDAVLDDALKQLYNINESPQIWTPNEFETKIEKILLKKFLTKEIDAVF